MAHSNRNEEEYTIDTQMVTLEPSPGHWKTRKITLAFGDSDLVLGVEEAYHLAYLLTHAANAAGREPNMTAAFRRKPGDPIPEVPFTWPAKKETL